MSDIQPGDRVRCTLGDNVLVGKVMGPVTDTHLSLIYGNAKYARLDRATWKVEVLDAEPDNFPTEPGLYEVTYENGVVSPFNPYEVNEDGRYRATFGGPQSDWEEPFGAHRRATWKRLPDPLPPEPPVGTVLRDRHGIACQRMGDGWWGTGSSLTFSWEQIQEYAPFTRLVAPDPDDEQQVKALARALEKADPVEWDLVARAAVTFLRDGGGR